MTDITIRLIHRPGVPAGDWYAGWEGDPVTHTYPDGHMCRISVMAAYGNSPEEALSTLGQRLTKLGVLT